MGTELQYAASLFSALTKNNGDAVTLGLDTPPDTCWTFSKNRSLNRSTQTGFDRLQESMDRLLEERNSRESLRNTMLNHDRIFKDQVHELHRLYGIQKILMAELRCEELRLHPLAYATPGTTADPGAGFRSSVSNGGAQTTSHSPPVVGKSSNRRSAQWNSDTNFYPAGRHSTRRGSLSSQELSISSGENLRMQYSKDKMSMNNLHLSSSDDDDEESEIELTLSIGCSGTKKKSRPLSHSNIESGCSGGSTSNSTRQPVPSDPARPDPEECSNPSAGFDRRRQRPSWPSQALSLNNRT